MRFHQRHLLPGACLLYPEGERYSARRGVVIPPRHRYSGLFYRKCRGEYQYFRWFRLSVICSNPTRVTINVCTFPQSLSFTYLLLRRRQTRSRHSYSSCWPARKTKTTTPLLLDLTRCRHAHRRMLAWTTTHRTVNIRGNEHNNPREMLPATFFPADSRV